jgi:hypothetical protein
MYRADHHLRGRHHDCIFAAFVLSDLRVLISVGHSTLADSAALPARQNSLFGVAPTTTPTDPEPIQIGGDARRPDVVGQSRSVRPAGRPAGPERLSLPITSLPSWGWLGRRLRCRVAGSVLKVVARWLDDAGSGAFEPGGSAAASAATSIMGRAPDALLA